MSAPDQSKVQALLKPHEAALTAVVLHAWERWAAIPERAQLYRRVRAGLVHNFMMLHAIQTLPPLGFLSRERHESAMFLIDDRLLVRFKKGDERGLSSNIDTQASLAFNDPNESFPLFDFDLPDIERVDVTYRLNDIDTKIQDILVVARQGDRIRWAYAIYEAAAAAGGETIPLPIAPIEPPAADSGMRVPAQEDEKQQNDGAN